MLINPIEEHKRLLEREIYPLSIEDTKALISKLQEIHAQFPSRPVVGKCGAIGNYDPLHPGVGNYILVLSKAPASTIGPALTSFEMCETQTEAAQRSLIAVCAEGAWQRWIRDPVGYSKLPKERPFTYGLNYGGLYQTLDRLLRMAGLSQGFSCQYALSLARQGTAPPVQPPIVQPPVQPPPYYPPPVNPPINVGNGSKTGPRENKVLLWVVLGLGALVAFALVMDI